MAENQELSLSGPVGGAQRVHDLDALGVVGLRMSDLQLENVACCGDCRFLALCLDSAGAQVAVCTRGYATSLYSTRAARCPDFSVRAPLPDVPQHDERSRLDRRQTTLIVLDDRRSGRDRRRAS